MNKFIQWLNVCETLILNALLKKVTQKTLKISLNLFHMTKKVCTLGCFNRNTLVFVTYF